MQHRTLAAAALLLGTLGLTAAVAAPASAASASTNLAGGASAAQAAALPCGYLAYKGSPTDQPRYNHCGRGDIVLKVDHWFWQRTYDCVAPGVHYIDQGNSNFAIIGAEYDGHSCTFPGPVVGP
jgi:hypothetical protein